MKPLGKLLFAAALFVHFEPAIAAPNAISFSGFLTNNSNTPLNGSYDLTFQFLAASSTIKLSIGPVTTTVTAGRFQAVLSDPALAVIFSDADPAAKIRVSIGGETLSDIPLTSVPYALNSPGGGGGAPPLGSVLTTFATNAPGGYLEANGREVNAALYPNLVAAMGPTVHPLNSTVLTDSGAPLNAAVTSPKFLRVGTRLFTAVGGAGIFYSDNDGESWTAVSCTGCNGPNYYGLFHANGYSVAYGSNTLAFASGASANWQLGTNLPVPLDHLHAVATGFVAIKNDGVVTATTDFLVWSARGNVGQSITHTLSGQNLLIALGSNSPPKVSTNGGANWDTSPSALTPQPILSVMFDGSDFCVYYDQATGLARTFRSRDGITWSDLGINAVPPYFAHKPMNVTSLGVYGYNYNPNILQIFNGPSCGAVSLRREIVTSANPIGLVGGANFNSILLFGDIGKRIELTPDTTKFRVPHVPAPPGARSYIKFTN